MSLRRAELFLSSSVSRAGPWLLPTALLALTPKCLLCLLGYAGLGAAFGLGGPELCGAPSGSPESWPSSLAWAGAALGMLAFLAVVRCCRRSAPPIQADR